MNNEIGRKITSLTLMIIMVAGGLTFAIPGEMPTAHAATANLFVSAENSLFDNSFAGPMVIEVIINDPDLKEIDESEAEPDVTVNDQDLRMVQATDGNWYAYFADLTMANAADGQSLVNGTSLDFGEGCTDTSANGANGYLGYGDSDGVYFDRRSDNGGAPGTLGTCTGFDAGVVTGQINVVRENKTQTRVAGGVNGYGQVGVAPNEFPMIQLYDFAVDGDVTVKYNVGGPAQQIVLNYLDDADGYASLETDRENYPRDASIHITVTDLQLNIDPTDEDSWTFATNSTTGGGPNRVVAGTAQNIAANGTQTFYNLFNENGQTARSSTGASISAVGGSMPPIDMGALNFDDNGVLIINVDTQNTGVDVVGLRDNNDQNVTGTTYSTAAFAGVGEGSGGFLAPLSGPVTLTETQANTGIFKNTDEGDNSNIFVTGGALRGTTATIDYNDTAESVLVLFYLGELSIDQDGVGGEWNSGEDVGVTLTDGDVNKNSLVDEDLDVNNPAVDIIPSIRIGSPITQAGTTAATIDGGTNDLAVGNRTTAAGPGASVLGNSLTVDAFSDRVNLGVTTPIRVNSGTELTLFMDETGADLSTFLSNGTALTSTQSVYNYFNYDFRGLESNGTDIFDGATLNFTIANSTLLAVADFLPGETDFQGLKELSSSNSKLHEHSVGGTDTVDLKVNFTGTGANTLAAGNYTFVADFFSFGQTGDGFLPSERINNAIYRLELEETGDNTSIFEGTIEFTMLNQISVNDTDTYLDFISSIDSDVEMIVHNDLTDEDSVRVNYFDVDDTGVPTTTSDQIEAPTHSGVVSFDQSNYKVGDLVIVSLDDTDLNADVETVDIFTVVGLTPAGGAGEVAIDQVGAPMYGVNSFGDNFGRVLDITFDDELWQRSAAGGCAAVPAIAEDNGLGSTGFTLIEDAPDAGTFQGTFLVPSQYCQTATGILQSVTGTDMEVNYVDYRDGSGEIIEVGDGAGIRANTGSVSLDRTVYPVPFGVPADFGGAGTTQVPSARSVFPVHQTGMAGTPGLDAGEFIATGDLTIHVRINDPDFDISAAGEDVVATLTNRTLIPSAVGLAVDGPLKITVSRGASEVVLATAGGPAAIDGVITTLNATVTEVTFDATAAGVPGSGVAPTLQTRELGPITEVAPDAGIFELDVVVRYTDGPASATCPTTTAYTNIAGNGRADSFGRFADNIDTHCILQGDIVTVEYTDPTDASGNPNTVTDSATFDLRNGVLQSDKSVYIIGSDAILTLIEPDFDLENDEAETYDLDLLEWDSDAATVTMGNLGPAVFDPEPSDLRETGDSTGIFQIVVEIPNVIAGDNLERGEEIILEYTDWGPSGSDYVGDEDEDVNLTIFTSNFGATVELDQKVYSWTDKAFITIVAPDHNFDSNLIDEIGDSPTDPIKVSTRGFDIDNYRLVETGTDTGIFTGEVILTGFAHDADGDGGFDAPTSLTSADGSGPTDGFLETDDDDGITVSFEFSEDETVVGSALIRWNIGEVQWLEASYPATGTGVVRIVDPDLNLNPESVDNFDVDVWSDSDAGGIDLTVTETNEATGIFEGTVFFTITDESSGHRLRVSEGDTITAEYEDNTLPDPYTTADELDITGTSIIGTVVPPLDRAPASGLRVVDAFANALASISVDQQVQITADLANGQDRDQPFAYLVQVQDGNGVTVALAWISGTLAPGQSFSPALSWTPSASGTYDITAFVWESVDNPTALSPPVSTTITVN